MFRYKLRSLLIALGILPPISAGLWFAGAPAWFLVVMPFATYPLLKAWVAR